MDQYGGTGGNEGRGAGLTDKEYVDSFYCSDRVDIVQSFLRFNLNHSDQHIIRFLLIYVFCDAKREVGTNMAYSPDSNRRIFTSLGDSSCDVLEFVSARFFEVPCTVFKCADVGGGKREDVRRCDTWVP